MRSDWDPEHAARKGKNADGGKRLAQFTEDELRIMWRGLNSVKVVVGDTVKISALRKIEARLAQIEARRGHSR